MNELSTFLSVGGSKCFFASISVVYLSIMVYLPYYLENLAEKNGHCRTMNNLSYISPSINKCFNQRDSSSRTPPINKLP